MSKDACKQCGESLSSNDQLYPGICIHCGDVRYFSRKKESNDEFWMLFIIVIVMIIIAAWLVFYLELPMPERLYLKG